MRDNLYVGDEARQKLIAGFDKVADAVKGTLGAAGYNGILEAFEYPYSITTNDGISIARGITLVDPVESIGANIAKEIATRADKNGGDGTTTALTLGQAIMHLGAEERIAPMALKRSLEDCLPIIEASIKEQTRQVDIVATIEGCNMLERVAAVSAEDEVIGKTIADIYKQIGKDGILYPDVSKTIEDRVEYSTGVKIEDAGLASPYMADVDEKTMQPMSAATLKDATVLVTKQKITNARRDLETIVGQLQGKNVRELVVFCNEMEPTVIPDVVTTRFKAGFRIIIVKLPVIYRDQWFEDLGKLTGATVIDPAAGLSFATMKVQHLGKVGSFLADKHNTFLDGTLDVSEYVKKLSEGEDEEKIRAARLNTKTARYFVGAPTDAALSYKRLKVEDARNAAYQALREGVVAGGGVALVNAAMQMPNTTGGKILRQALIAPINQIRINAGYDPVKYLYSGTDTGGFDARSGEEIDMFKAGIIDPAAVVMSSVRNAISVAATVLTARVVVVMNKEPQQQISSAMPQI